MIFKYKRMRKKSQKSLTFDAKIKITGSKNSLSPKLNSEQTRKNKPSHIIVQLLNTKVKKKLAEALIEKR